MSVLLSLCFFFTYTSTTEISTLSLHDSLVFFLNDPAPTEISPLPLPAPLPICRRQADAPPDCRAGPLVRHRRNDPADIRGEGKIAPRRCTRRHHHIRNGLRVEQRRGRRQ